jgi:hypothetical protein
VKRSPFPGRTADRARDRGPDDAPDLPLRAAPDRPPQSARDRDRERIKRAAINALKRAGRAADRAGVDLSAWEGEFLGSVTARVETYGRAFADPEKGASGAALSVLQTRKLKEIIAKAKGEAQWGAVRGRNRPGPAGLGREDP